MAPMISMEELHSFHTIDREIFSRLVINLVRDPGQSLLIMAFWMCLEEMNFPRIVQKITCLPDGMLKALAEEAVTCLTCLDSKTPPMYPDGSLPLTTVIVGRRVSLTLFYGRKFTIICAVKSFLNNVCAIIFSDIISRVIYPTRPVLYNHPLLIPGFPHPTFGSVTVIPRPPGHFLPGKTNWSILRIEAPVDDRTMFLTFSRGYPVSEEEVRELFTTQYGDCVELLSMEPSPSFPDQSLYARLVVRDIETIDRILSKGPIAKYKISGKHVWARKFERREPC